MYIWDADPQMCNTQKCNSNGRECKENCCTRAYASKSAQFLHKLHDIDAPCATASDAWQSESNGAVPLVATTEHYDSNRGITPYQLLHGGHHSDDLGINVRAVMQH
jgi:hypothetical protein